ncbi:hypothetical protein VTN31DRAFT_483 [Thermomyces dupontii]|uniref:uncharacterized protein n=1 Tax=Talaromyces thermophilus TaxID=28565 RepID=UPI003743A203
MTTSTPPAISHILETILYVNDLEAATAFYQKTLNQAPFFQSARGCGFSLGNTTLLLFQRGACTKDVVSPDGVIPGHGPEGEENMAGNERTKLRQHFCFAVSTPQDVEKWDAHLQSIGVKVIARMNWTQRGGKSVYFEDPDGHIGEIGSRGIWPHY